MGHNRYSTSKTSKLDHAQPIVMVNSRKIEDLKPEAQNKCKEFIQKCSDAKIPVKIIQTLRDSEYQSSLYAQGRTKPGNIVTNADGIKKKSNHQSGEVDINMAV
jgi:glutamine phosphoribosylpyrophosphate amidotransferase